MYIYIYIYRKTALSDVTEIQVNKSYFTLIQFRMSLWSKHVFRNERIIKM